MVFIERICLYEKSLTQNFRSKKYFLIYACIYDPSKKRHCCLCVYHGNEENNENKTIFFLAMKLVACDKHNKEIIVNRTAGIENKQTKIHNQPHQ